MRTADDDELSRIGNSKLKAQLDADRRRRYSAKSPMPSIFKWWAKRQAWTLILTLALPFVCWGFSAFEKAHAHGEHGGEHGHGAAGAEGHGGHAEGHGGHEAVAGHGADAEAAAHGGDAIFTFTHNLHDATTSFAASHPEAAAHRRLSAHGAEEEGGHGEEEGEEEEEGGCYDDPHYKWDGPDPTSDSRTCQDLTPLIGSADCDAEHNAETVAFYCPLTCGTCKKPHWYHHVQRTASAVHHAAHAAVHHAAHHVEGFVEAQAQLSIIIVLVIFTLIFENGKEVVEEKFRKYRPVLERIWGELTVLGFLALVTFILLQSEVLQHISEAVFEDDEHLVHMFEKIHFALFFVLVLFLMWALWLLACVAKREQILDAHETQIIYYGRLAKAKGGSEGPSVEDYGYLVCQEDLRHAAGQLALQTGQTIRDVWPEQEPQIARFTRSARYVTLENGKVKRAPMEERIAPKPAETPPQVSGPQRLRRPSPCAYVRCKWLLAEAKQRARFQMLRHRFILGDAPVGGGKGGREMLPADFQFSNYQQECAKSFLEHTLHLANSSWLVSLLVMTALIECGEELSSVTLFGEPLTLWLLITLGWAVLGAAQVVLEHYNVVLERLLPIGPSSEPPEEQVRAVSDAPSLRLVRSFAGSGPIDDDAELEAPLIKEVNATPVQTLSAGTWKLTRVQKGVSRQLGLYRLRVKGGGHGHGAALLAIAVRRRRRAVALNEHRRGQTQCEEEVTVEEAQRRFARLADGELSPPVALRGLRAVHRQRLSKGLHFVCLRCPSGRTIEAVLRTELLADQQLGQLYRLGDALSVSGALEARRGRLSIRATRLSVDEPWTSLFGDIPFVHDFAAAAAAGGAGDVLLQTAISHAERVRERLDANAGVRCVAGLVRPVADGSRHMECGLLVELGEPMPSLEEAVRADAALPDAVVQRIYPLSERHGTLSAACDALAGMILAASPRPTCRVQASPRSLEQRIALALHARGVPLSLKDHSALASVAHVFGLRALEGEDALLSPN